MGSRYCCLKYNIYVNVNTQQGCIGNKANNHTNCSNSQLLTVSSSFLARVVSLTREPSRISITPLHVKGRSAGSSLLAHLLNNSELQQASSEPYSCEKSLKYRPSTPSCSPISLHLCFTSFAISSLFSFVGTPSSAATQETHYIIDDDVSRRSSIDQFKVH